MQQQDRKRVQRAQKASEDVAKEARHACHLASRQMLAQLEIEEGVQYGAGQF